MGPRCWCDRVGKRQNAPNLIVRLGAFAVPVGNAGGRGSWGPAGSPRVVPLP